MSNKSWGQLAAEAIAVAHSTVPEGATLAQRKRIIDLAYPFGQRRHWPYKAWLAQRRKYLAPYGGHKPSPSAPLLPLFQADQKGAGV